MNLADLFDLSLLEQHRASGYVRLTKHPSLPLAILNYTERCAYDGAWDAVTLQCRGLIYHLDTLEVVARPFPKFFNHGQPGAPELDLDAPAVVTDKLDGSLGILYSSTWKHEIATRGSFTSEQALHATAVYLNRYAEEWEPLDGLTYLFEIIYPGNRIVCDYGGRDELVLLDIIENSTGMSLRHAFTWPGPETETLPYTTLADALRAEPRPNAEGVVVYLPDTGDRVKIKQDDYIAMHRILTGTNARNVWEIAAVRACARYVHNAKEWGSFLRIDPVRAEEVQALADNWLADVPDEFYGWIEETTADAEQKAYGLIHGADEIVGHAKTITDRRTRYEYVSGTGHPATQELMRLADGRDELARLVMRCWLEARPEPTHPFHRDEAVA